MRGLLAAQRGACIIARSLLPSLCCPLFAARPQLCTRPCAHQSSLGAHDEDEDEDEDESGSWSEDSGGSGSGSSDYGPDGLAAGGWPAPAAGGAAAGGGGGAAAPGGAEAGVAAGAGAGTGPRASVARWVPYRHTNGVAIYRHPLEGEYMASSIVKVRLWASAAGS
jgi:hypothetical protein